MPAFLGHLNGVGEPSILVLLPSSAPALNSDVNMEHGATEIPNSPTCEWVFFFFSFSSAHIH